MQVYIVSGGCCGYLTSTETLLKDTGTQWQIAADLPSGRHAHIGIGLDNGKFLVAGQDIGNFQFVFSIHHHLQVVRMKMEKWML